MTRSNQNFRAAALAGLALSAVSLLQVSAQSRMPTPHYQTPGVAAPQAPTPQLNFPVTPAITVNGTVAEEVIVRVNDQIISRSDLQRGEAVLQGELAQTGATPAEAAERQKNMLRDLIDQQLLISKAKDNGVNADAEVIRRLDEIRKQNNLPSMEALEQAARQQGYSFEDFKANIRNSVMTQSVVRDEVGRSLRMTHADEVKYYDAHKDQFNQPEQVRLSEILIPTPTNPDDAAIAAALVKANDTYDKLKGGADFAATAKSVSGGPTAAQGGDLGVFKRGQLAKVLEDKTFPLAPGTFTEPVRTRQGFVILKAVDHIDAGIPPLEKVEGEIQNAMYQEAIQPALRAYLTRLREDSYVEVKPSFIDTGASPKQTKPIYASYAAPPPKKKTVTKRRLDEQKDKIRLENAGLTVKNGAVQPLANVQLDRHGKPKKVKREKVRFGQSPRTALPDAGVESTPTVTTAATSTPSASGQDSMGTAETNSALSANGVPGSASASTSSAAPGTQMAPTSSNNTVAVNESDPLAPVAAPQKKSRFSSREPEVKEAKKKRAVDKAIDHVNAKPGEAGSDEKQTAAVQSTALGLSGDNSKKKKRAKGEPKERLQDKAPEAKPDLVDNGLPDRLHQQNGPQQTSGTPSASSQTGNLPAQNSKQTERERRGKEPVTNQTGDATTLPPVNQPAPGTTLPAQVPSTNGALPTNDPSHPITDPSQPK